MCLKTARLHVPHIAFTETTRHVLLLFWTFCIMQINYQKRHSIARLRKGHSLKYLQLGKNAKMLILLPDIVITKAVCSLFLERSFQVESSE